MDGKKKSKPASVFTISSYPNKMRAGVRLSPDGLLLLALP